MLTIFSDLLKKIAPKETSALSKFFHCFNDQVLCRQSEANSSLSRLTAPATCLYPFKLVEINQTDLTNNSYSFKGNISFNEGKYFNESSQLLYKIKLPADIIDVQFIQDRPSNPKILLQQNIDFVIEKGYLITRKDLSKLGFNSVFKQLANFPDLFIQLWFGDTQVNKDQLNKTFGKWVGFNTKPTFSNGTLLNLIFDALQQGLSEAILKRILCILTDTSYVDTGGIVTDIFIEGDYNVVIINDIPFTSPRSAEVLVSVGDLIKDGQFLFNNAGIYTRSDNIPEDTISGIHLGESLIGSEFQGGIFIENITSNFPGLNELVVSDKISAEVLTALLDGQEVYLTNGDHGSSLDLLVSDQDAAYEVIRLYDILPFKGHPDTVTKFIQKINEQAAYQGKTVLDVIIDKNNQRPKYINLFDHYRKFALGSNTAYVYINNNALDIDININQTLTYLDKLIPVGTCLLTFFQNSSIVEYNTNNITESLETFYVSDLEDTANSFTDDLKVRSHI